MPANQKHPRRSKVNPYISSIVLYSFAAAAHLKMSRPLDVIIFGASGFTGKYTIYEGIKILANLKWGIAGRSQSKLENALKEMGKKAGKSLDEIPITIADIQDKDALVKMAAQCRVVVNCCGPFRLYGEPVVAACIEAGTHYVDVSGEPQFMEKIQLEYNEQAKEKNLFIISACGFDSIPADMGVIFLEQKFQGVVNSVESYLDMKNSSNASGAQIHYGTWESAVHGLSTAEELAGLRKKLFKDRLPKFHPTLRNRPVVHKSPLVGNKWCLPFMGSDRSVVMRSQRYFYEKEEKRPVQMRPYFATPSLFHTVLIMFVGLVFGIMTRFCLGRSLLLRFPKIFSLGFVSHEGPSEEMMENTTFTMSMEGRGWEEKLSSPTDQYTEPPNKKLAIRVSGTNPGYGATCVALLLAATTILKEGDKMPKG